MTMDLHKEFRKIKYITEDIANLKAGDLDGSCRKTHIVLARMVFANVLQFGIGVKPKMLREYLNRDRTSFHYYKKMHEKYMSNDLIYPEYNEMYEKVLNTYHTLQDRLFEEGGKLERQQFLIEVEQKIEEFERRRAELRTQIELLR